MPSGTRRWHHQKKRTNTYLDVLAWTGPGCTEGGRNSTFRHNAAATVQQPEALSTYESRDAPSCTLWTGTGLASWRPDVENSRGHGWLGQATPRGPGGTKYRLMAIYKRRSRRVRLLRMVGHYMRGTGILAAPHAFCIFSFDLGRRLPDILAFTIPSGSYLHDRHHIAV